MIDITIIGNAAAVAGAMIALDVVAGLVSAASRGELDSTKLRQGLMHKAGLCLAFSLAIVLEYGESVVPLGISVPLVIPVVSYIILMEACSVYENIKRINPDFEFSRFEDLFDKIDKDGEEPTHDADGDN